MDIYKNFSQKRLRLLKWLLNPNFKQKKSEKSNEPILRNGNTDGGADGAEFIGPLRRWTMQKASSKCQYPTRTINFRIHFRIYFALCRKASNQLKPYQNFNIISVLRENKPNYCPLVRNFFLIFDMKNIEMIDEALPPNCHYWLKQCSTYIEQLKSSNTCNPWC